MYTANEFDYSERESQLYDWVDNCGMGIMGIDTVPEECFGFILSQYKRFNIPYNEDIFEVLDASASIVLHYLDTVDPYAFFMGLTDVEMTDEWKHKVFEVVDGDFCHEVAPEKVETFRLVPGKDIEAFDYYMSHPGLDVMQQHTSYSLRMLLDGDWTGDPIEMGITNKAAEALCNLCSDANGVPDRRKEMVYFDIASWAALLWLIGPLGREFRNQCHDIFYCCYMYGEAILHDGVVISPTKYRKIDRKPNSCYKCGVSAWCVEMTQDEATTRHICERCLNYDLPQTGFANCGTKYCKDVSCPHNPYYNVSNGLQEAYRHGGQLACKVRGHFLDQEMRKQLLISS